MFPEELERWGEKVDAPRIGSVALCHGENGYGMAVWWEDGWLSFRETEVTWCPHGLLEVVGIYCRLKPSSVKS